MPHFEANGDSDAANPREQRNDPEREMTNETDKRTMHDFYDQCQRVFAEQGGMRVEKNLGGEYKAVFKRFPGPGIGLELTNAKKQKVEIFFTVKDEVIVSLDGVKLGSAATPDRPEVIGFQEPGPKLDRKKLNKNVDAVISTLERFYPYLLPIHFE